MATYTLDPQTGNFPPFESTPRPPEEQAALLQEGRHLPERRSEPRYGVNGMQPLRGPAARRVGTITDGSPGALQFLEDDELPPPSDEFFENAPPPGTED